MAATLFFGLLLYEFPKRSFPATFQLEVIKSKIRISIPGVMVEITHPNAIHENLR